MKKKTGLMTAIFSIVLCGVFFLGGFLIAGSNEMQYHEERIEVVLIENEKDLLNLGNGIYNDKIKLANDIEVTKACGLNSSEFPFVGVFDGNGYTITYKGIMGESFLGYIGEGGKVCNLNLEVETFATNEEVMGVLAKENRGAIMDCSVTVKSFQTHKDGDYGAVVALNNGVVQHTIANVQFKNLNEEGYYTIGGIAAHNYQTIRYCISEISFDGYLETDLLYAIDHSIQNVSIGSIYGRNGIRGQVQQSCAVISENTNVCDAKNMEITFCQDHNEVFQNDNLFRTMQFSEKVWRLQGNHFKLISGRIVQ